MWDNTQYQQAQGPGDWQYPGADQVYRNVIISGGGMSNRWGEDQGTWEMKGNKGIKPTGKNAKQGTKGGWEEYAEREFPTIGYNIAYNYESQGPESTMEMNRQMGYKGGNMEMGYGDGKGGQIGQYPEIKGKGVWHYRESQDGQSKGPYSNYGMETLWGPQGKTGQYYQVGGEKGGVTWTQPTQNMIMEQKPQTEEEYKEEGKHQGKGIENYEEQYEGRNKKKEKFKLRNKPLLRKYTESTDSMERSDDSLQEEPGSKETNKMRYMQQQIRLLRQKVVEKEKRETRNAEDRTYSGMGLEKNIATTGYEDEHRKKGGNKQKVEAIESSESELYNEKDEGYKLGYKGKKKGIMNRGNSDNGREKRAEGKYEQRKEKQEPQEREYNKDIKYIKDPRQGSSKDSWTESQTYKKGKHGKGWAKEKEEDYGKKGYHTDRQSQDTWDRQQEIEEWFPPEPPKMKRSNKNEQSTDYHQLLEGKRQNRERTEINKHKATEERPNRQYRWIQKSGGNTTTEDEEEESEETYWKKTNRQGRQWQQGGTRKESRWEGKQKDQARAAIASEENTRKKENSKQGDRKEYQEDAHYHGIRVEQGKREDTWEYAGRHKEYAEVPQDQRSEQRNKGNVEEYRVNKKIGERYIGPRMEERPQLQEERHGNWREKQKGENKQGKGIILDPMRGRTLGYNGQMNKGKQGEETKGGNYEGKGMQDQGQNVQNLGIIRIPLQPGYGEGKQKGQYGRYTGYGRFQNRGNLGKQGEQHEQKKGQEKDRLENDQSEVKITSPLEKEGNRKYGAEQGARKQTSVTIEQKQENIQGKKFIPQQSKTDMYRIGDDKKSTQEVSPKTPLDGPEKEEAKLDRDHEKLDAEEMETQKGEKQQENSQEGVRQQEERAIVQKASDRKRPIQAEEKIHQETQDQYIRLHINKRHPKYSVEELKFFRAAIEENHTSQTHFTDPSSDYCYRCPLCKKTINRENLTDLIRLHFSMMHNKPNVEYSIVVNGKVDNPVIISNIGKKGRNRDGAQPPAQEFLEKYCGEIPHSQRQNKKQRREKEKSSDDKVEDVNPAKQISLNKKKRMKKRAPEQNTKGTMRKKGVTIKQVGVKRKGKKGQNKGAPKKGKKYRQISEQINKKEAKISSLANHEQKTENKSVLEDKRRGEQDLKGKQVIGIEGKGKDKQQTDVGENPKKKQRSIQDFMSKIQHKGLGTNNGAGNDKQEKEKVGGKEGEESTGKTAKTVIDIPESQHIEKGYIDQKKEKENVGSSKEGKQVGQEDPQ